MKLDNCERQMKGQGRKKELQNGKKRKRERNIVEKRKKKEGNVNVKERNKERKKVLCGSMKKLTPRILWNKKRIKILTSSKGRVEFGENRNRPFSSL